MFTQKERCGSTERSRQVGEERKEMKRVKGAKVTSLSGSDDKQGKITQQCESTEGGNYNARDANTLLSLLP
jgi:hypothetical protein